MQPPQAAYLLSFGSAVDAVRFCHSSQALLMYSQWGADCADYCGRTGARPRPACSAEPLCAPLPHLSCWAFVPPLCCQGAASRCQTLAARMRIRRLCRAAPGAHPLLPSPPCLCRAGPRWQAHLQGPACGHGHPPELRVQHRQVGPVAGEPRWQGQGPDLARWDPGSEAVFGKARCMHSGSAAARPA